MGQLSDMLRMSADEYLAKQAVTHASRINIIRAALGGDDAPWELVALTMLSLKVEEFGYKFERLIDVIGVPNPPKPPEEQG